MRSKFDPKYEIFFRSPVEMSSTQREYIYIYTPINIYHYITPWEVFLIPYNLVAAVSGFGHAMFYRMRTIA